MFTGLVEAVGEIVETKPIGGGTRLRIATSLAGELSAGDSLAVNGVCLTVILAESTEVHADVGPETLRVTTSARWPATRSSTSNGRCGPTAGSAGTSCRGTSMRSATSKTSGTMPSSTG